MGSRLRDRVAIITGASSGIGRAIACELAREGAQTVLADLQASPVEGGEPTHELIERAGAKARFVATDVASSADVDRLVDTTVDEHGRVDILVNNAATYVGKPLLETSETEWDRVFAVNLKSVFLLSRRVVAQMIGQEPLGRQDVRGRIVNVTSQHGMVAAPKDIAYGTSKSGVVYITRQIATDYAAQGIVCNAVAPGKIFTGKGGRELDPEWVASWKARTPIPRDGRPEDVARAALFLASDDATFITGVNLMVDGGWSAS
jgi:NAD(P)-dependent dehydrogenase (short-subunit alcohol dehydrogenase family)